jgi:DNA replication protein DnaC
MSISGMIRDEYALKRLRAELDRDRRASAAYAAAPRLEEIASERRDAIVALGLARVNRRDEAMLIHKLDMLDKEQAALLAMLGLPADALELRFECPHCADTGYIAGVMCACMKQRLFAEKYAHAQLNPSETFETFDAGVFPGARQQKLMAKAKEICEAYADGFPRCKPMGLLVMGKPGLGKTFLLNAIANRVFERGYHVAMLTAYRLVEQMQARIRSREAQDDYLEPDLLIIDDLGTEPLIGSITAEYLFAILNERQSRGRATLFATNLDQAMIGERYGERMFTRLISPMLSRAILLEGDDVRLRRGK